MLHRRRSAEAEFWVLAGLPLIEVRKANDSAAAGVSHPYLARGRADVNIQRALETGQSVHRERTVGTDSPHLLKDQDPVVAGVGDIQPVATVG